MLQPSDRKMGRIGRSESQCHQGRDIGPRAWRKRPSSRARRRPLAAPAWRGRATHMCRGGPSASLSGTKRLQEHRGGDRCRPSARRRIGEIGDVALEHFVIGIPQRHPPHRVPDAPAAVSMSAASSSSFENNAGSSGPSAIRAAPVRVAKSTISSGSSSAALASASASTRRPFGIGIVDLDEQALARLDDVAGPVGVRRRPHSRPPG